jgi:hypothetical protein
MPIFAQINSTQHEIQKNSSEIKWRSFNGGQTIWY